MFAMPILSTNNGNNNATKKQAIQRKTIESDMALPRMALGNNSEITTQVKGPIEQAKEAINKRIASNVTVLGSVKIN